MEFRIFRFKLTKDFNDLTLLKQDFERILSRHNKSFLKNKAEVVDEEEQTKGTRRTQKIYELKFKRFLQGISRFNFYSPTVLSISFYTERENERNGIKSSYKKYVERNIASKSPPEVDKRFYFWFKNSKEGIVFANWGNPKATNFLLEKILTKILPIEIIGEQKYSSVQVALLFERLKREHIIHSIKDVDVIVLIDRQNMPVSNLLIFKDVGSFEKYDALKSKYEEIKISKFSVELDILGNRKMVNFIFRNRSDFYPIQTSLKSRAHESYAKLFDWLGKILDEFKF